MTRQRSVIVFLLPLLLATIELAHAQEADRNDELRAAVSAFGRAFVKADTRALRSQLTAEYLHVNGSSGNVLDREEWLDWVESRRLELASGELVIESYDIGAVEVQIYDTTAVVTGVVESSGIRSGTRFTSRIRFTNVWVARGDAWLRAAFHDSPLPDA